LIFEDVSTFAEDVSTFGFANEQINGNRTEGALQIFDALSQ